MMKTVSIVDNTENDLTYRPMTAASINSIIGFIRNPDMGIHYNFGVGTYRGTFRNSDFFEFTGN